ncbi:MAG: Ig-like domain-containing protein, partial [Methanomassiliicoccales archaeon]|nr:Ig-like domain-containing protein [Methanomassiliicoccales archaeon]
NEELALSKGEMDRDSVVDFVSWCTDGEYVPGSAHDVAVEAGIWSVGDHYDGSFPSGLPLVGGFSIGRDAGSNDTQGSEDWCRNGGQDAYFATPGTVNSGPYFDVHEGIKMVQTKVNVLFLEWGYDVLDADHTLQSSEGDPNATEVSAVHRFAVDIGGLTFHYEGLGTYVWERLNGSTWSDSIHINLSSPDGASDMLLDYERTYHNHGLSITVEEETLGSESFEVIEGEYEEDPPEVELGSHIEYYNFTSSTVTNIEQVGPYSYTVITEDQKYLGHRNETQELCFVKNYTLIKDTEVEAWTDLTVSSDVRESMSVSTHYTQVTDIGWHRACDVGEMNVTYHRYNISYGDNEWTMDGEGHYTISVSSEDVYEIDWSVPVKNNASQESMTVGGNGTLEVVDREGETVYVGEFRSHDGNFTSRYCIDGYEAAIGGGVCAIAGGLIGSIWIGIGAVIGGGIGAIACGCGGAAIEEANEPDKIPPTISIELGESGSNKDNGWIKVTVTVHDDVGLDKVKTKRYSALTKKTWSSTTNEDGDQDHTWTKTFHNKECKEEWRTVTVTATDTSGNSKTESQLVRVPPRDCTPNVQNTTPQNKECCVPVDSEVVIEFCKPMNTTSAEMAISISPFAFYTKSWSSDDTTITLTFVSGLEPYTNYTVTINTMARSFAERPLLENYTFWFITEDPFGPELMAYHLPPEDLVHEPWLMVDGIIADNIGVTQFGYSIDNGYGFTNHTNVTGAPQLSLDLHMEIALEPGVNTIIIWAMDEYGNYVEVRWEITYEPLPP